MKGKEKNPFRVAIPCYGTRVLPRFGLAREFYFAEVDQQAKKVVDLKRKEWNPYFDPQMVRWLRNHNISGVLCGGIHPRFQMALMFDGIWILWGFRGEVVEILEKWLSGEVTGTLADGSFPFSAGCFPSFGRHNKRWSLKDPSGGEEL
jgi:predicted Fe-Mo cluster-binding NifX family protein